MAAYDAVIFDNDGVLTTPTDLDVLSEAVRESFRAHGVADPPDEDVDACFGTTPADLERVCSSHDIDPDGFWRRRDEAASRVQRGRIDDGHKTLYPDVREALDGIDVPRGIVSNNQQATIDYILEAFDLAGEFETAYGRVPTAADVGHKKPDPHYLGRAITDLGADRPLYVGDSDVDVAAAAALGVDVAFVRREHRATYVLDRTPTYEVADLTDVASLLS